MIGDKILKKILSKNLLNLNFSEKKRTEIGNIKGGEFHKKIRVTPVKPDVLGLNNEVATVFYQKQATRAVFEI